MRLEGPQPPFAPILANQESKLIRTDFADAEAWGSDVFSPHRRFDRDVRSC